MSDEKKKPAKMADAINNLIALARLTQDTYSNPAAKLGAGQPNLMNSAEYPIERITRDFTLLTSLYRNDWICKRIIDTPAEDMTRAWIKISSQIPPDRIKDLENAIAKTRCKDRIKNALKWSRLYGGSGAVILLAGQEDMMEYPLDLRTVMPDSFAGLAVLDRWNGISPTGELVDDMRDADFGKPEFYMIGGDEFGGALMRVHHSRILTFTGRELPSSEEVGEMYWGASEMEHIFDELNKRNTSSANIAQLLFQANLRVLKTGDLAEQLATMDPEALSEIYQVAQAQNELLSSFGLQFLDKDDQFQTYSYSFAGISDVYRSFMSDIAGAAEIPATKLFGRSPEGMNATGESDLTNYYDSINAKQESVLRPALEKLLPVVVMSTFGAIPDDFEFEFNPVRSFSEAERADLAKSTIDSILQVYNAELIDKPTALEELRKASSATGMFTSISDEQIEQAKIEMEQQAQQQEAQAQQVPDMAQMGIEGADGEDGQAQGQAQPEAPEVSQMPLQANEQQQQEEPEQKEPTADEQPKKRHRFHW